MAREENPSDEEAAMVAKKARPGGKQPSAPGTDTNWASNGPSGLGGADVCRELVIPRGGSCSGDCQWITGGLGAEDGGNSKEYFRSLVVSERLSQVSRQ